MSKTTRYKELSLTQLRSFSAVCEHGGYAAAARALLLTSPAIWEQVQALERHYGTPLLARHGHAVRPTPTGERLLDMIRPHLVGLDSMRQVLRQQEGSLPEQVTLITTLRVLGQEIGMAFARFRKRYPQIRLKVSHCSTHELEPCLRGGEADLAFAFEPRPDQPISSAIVYEPAGKIEYLLVTQKSHALLQQPKLLLERIVQYPLTLPGPETYLRHRIQEVLHRYNLASTVSIAVESSGTDYTLECVRAGLGVAITAGISRDSIFRGLGVRSLENWFGTARVGFLWQQGVHVPPILRELADTIRACVDARTRGR